MSASLDPSRTAIAVPASALPLAPTRPALPFGREFRSLLDLKRRTIGPMLGVTLAAFVVVLVLAGYARPLMTAKVAGSLPLGYALIAGIYGLCWGVAVLYAYLADARYDPQAERAVAEQGARP